MVKLMEVNWPRKPSELNDIMEVVNDHPVASQSEADMLAQSSLNDRCQTFFQAEGTCFGNTAVRAGKLIEIKGIGTRFSGDLSGHPGSSSL